MSDDHEPAADLPDDYPRDVDAHDRFLTLAAGTVADLLALDPVTATSVGVHDHDARLPDLSPEGLEHARQVLTDRLAEVDAIDDLALDVAERVDLEILRSGLASRLFALDDLRPYAWDPLVANPGTAVYALLARDFAPAEDRLNALVHRLDAVPRSLAVAREALGPMPRVHVETAIGQFRGATSLLGQPVDELLAHAPALRAEVDRARTAAAEALEEHVRWLEDALPGAEREPRLGAALYAGRLWHSLDTETPPDAVLVRAESDLMRVEEELAELCDGADVRLALDRVADDGPVDDATILPLCEAALVEAEAFVRAEDLVSVPDDPVRIIVMPEIHRGVAVAYCDPPGPLEPAPLPTFFAVSPTPADWPAERVRSFYREYNASMLRNLTVHEAMPGHVLQLAHSRRHRGSTDVRALLWSGPFAEGWAVYAEEVMARAGYGGRAVRLQQLKMQLRMTINTILDVRVHAHGMTQDEAMTLMMVRGHQEEGEAAGKWRRALLTSGQLSTYYVGYSEVSDIARELAVARPTASLRERHDAMIAHGTPPPRHLRPLLGLGGPSGLGGPIV